MALIIKIFGWASLVAGVGCLVSPITTMDLVVPFELSLGLILSGAMLVAFGQIVDLLGTISRDIAEIKQQGVIGTAPAAPAVPAAPPMVPVPAPTAPSAPTGVPVQPTIRLAQTRKTSPAPAVQPSERQDTPKS